MKPSYDPAATVPEASLDLDNDQVYWLGSERFTGFLGETLPGGNYEFQSYRDGRPDGPSGELSPDGDLLFEEWYRKNFLYGITRTFRHDGTLATAVGYEYGYAVWNVEFDLDGRTVRSTGYTRFDDSQLKSLRILRERVPMPPLLGPEHAADLNAH